MHLALVVLCTTMSFTVDMHYCGDHLVDVAINKQASSCGMQSQKKTTTSTDVFISKSSCCSNKHIIVEGQDTLQNIIVDYKLLDQLVFVAVMPGYDPQIFVEQNVLRTPFKAYSPPHLRQDFRIIYQQFRI